MMLILRRRGLIGYFPAVTLVILVGCLAGFVLELSFDRGLADFLFRYGLVPLQVAAYVGDVEGTSFVRSILPFFSSLFLHTGLFHLLVNIWYLWMLGDVLEAWLGRVQYAVLFVVGAGVQALMSLVVSALAGGPFAGVPSIGISGSIAALIGGYAAVLIVLFRRREVSDGRSVMLWLPMAVGLMGWFGLQCLNGVLSLPVLTSQNASSVPWISLGASAVVGALMVGFTRPRGAFAAGTTEACETASQDAASEPLRRQA